MIRKILGATMLVVTCGFAVSACANSNASHDAQQHQTKQKQQQLTKPEHKHKHAAPVSAGVLVSAVTKGQLEISKEFTVSGGLRGLVVEPKQGGRGMVVFTNKKAKYLFIGNLINAKGENLTQTYTKKYVDAAVAKKAFKSLSGTTWFAEGSDTAPHKLYAVIDPNCIFCHMLYKEFAPLIKAGKLQVRWVAAGFLKPGSKGKAAKILSGKTDADKIKLLHSDEVNFKKKSEEGGVQPLTYSANLSTAEKAAFADVEANTKFFMNYFQGTPVLLYRGHDGQPHFVGGYVEGDALTALLKKVGSRW